jgi:hypothetical protein
MRGRTASPHPTRAAQPSSRRLRKLACVAGDLSRKGRGFRQRSAAAHAAARDEPLKEGRRETCVSRAGFYTAGMRRSLLALGAGLL